MNILLVAYYFPPINCAGSVRPLQMAHWLRRSGHSVTVLTHAYRSALQDDAETIRVHDPACARAHSGKNRLPWLLYRGFSEAQNALGRYASIFSPWKRNVLARMDEIGRRTRPDLVIATYPPLETLEIGLEFSRRLQIPLVSDFRDGLMFLPIEGKRLAAHRCVREKYRRTEAEAAAGSALITSVTPVLHDYFQQAYPASRGAVIYNGYDPLEWSDLTSVPLPSGCTHIVHTGRFALSDAATNIRPFLIALRQAGKDKGLAPFRLHLAGEISGREKKLLRDFLVSGRAVIHPLAERRQALALQESADLLLLVTRPGERSGVPLKLFEYLFSQTPVLALSDDREIRRIVSDSNCGWCVSPGDAAGITGMLERLLGEPRFRLSLQRRPAVIAAFSWEKQMEELNRRLASLTA